MALDPNTLVVMTLVNFTICVFAALFIWYTNRPVAGLISVATGFLCVSVGFGTAFLLQPVLGKAAIWMGNAAMICGLFSLLDGALRFRGLPRVPWWVFLLISLPFLFAETYLLFVRDDRPLRMAILAVLMGAIAFAGAAAMLYRVRKEDRIVHGFVALGFALYSGSQVLRTAAYFLPALGSDPPSILVLINIAMIGGLFGLSTATNLRLKERVEKVALSDPLTGLPNRRAFDDRLDRVHTRAIATGSPVTLIYIDLDRFKTINDRFGHVTGDLALKQVADRLSSVIAEEDCLARLGGDEFAVLSERLATRAAASSLAEELQKALSDPMMVGGHAVHLTISCGLAFYPDDVRTTSELVREADAEMYQMKRRVPTI